MPVILPRDAEPAWLDHATPRAELLELLSPLPSGQTAVVPVGPAVNDARYDGPECLAPAGRAGSNSAPTQPTLF
jgi:putative SOS response-associated peptidase YedK